jgi:inward rectifier potassium channel
VSRLAPQATYAFRIIGGPPPRFRDAYHALLRVPWWQAILTVTVLYMSANVLFAFVYQAVGGISSARPGSFEDAFYFSVETMATIGYGAMAPVTRAANCVMVVQSMVGLIASALITGLIFVRFSQTRGRILFSAKCCISPMDGVPTLMVRLGNERANVIYDAEMRLTLSRTQKTLEGRTIYRAMELKLVRERAPNLSRAWNVMHKIDAESPLYGETAESLAQQEAEVSIAVAGIDDTSLQLVHGRHMYEHTSILFGQRLVDILTELPNGDMQLDLSRFHEVEAA